jgi:hypothetical protein
VDKEEVLDGGSAVGSEEGAAEAGATWEDGKRNSTRNQRF